MLLSLYGFHHFTAMQHRMFFNVFIQQRDCCNKMDLSDDLKLQCKAKAILTVVCKVKKRQNSQGCHNLCKVLYHVYRNLKYNWCTGSVCQTCYAVEV